MPNVTLVGLTVFRGWTQEGTELVLAEGETADVSAETAAQLEQDHGHWFSIDGEPPADPPAPASALDADEDTKSELLEKTRGQLEEIAGELGIEDAGSFPNKGALADAILAAAGDEGGDDEPTAGGDDGSGDDPDADLD